MMKRSLSIVFLAVATVCMVLTTVMPHHHHGNTVCIDIEHCAEDFAHHHCNHPAANDPCAVNAEFFISEAGGDLKCKLHHASDDCCGGHQSLPVILPSVLASCPDTPPERIEYGEYTVRPYSAHLSRIPGLRAPPLV